MYDDVLIDKLCMKHLLEGYNKGFIVLSALRIRRVSQGPIYKEFKDAPLHLAYKLQLYYDQGKKIGLQMTPPPEPFSISDEPIRKWWKERKSYVPLMTVAEQWEKLHLSPCGCAI